MACKHLVIEQHYGTWCELYPSWALPPCMNSQKCEYDERKEYNSTTDTWE